MGPDGYKGYTDLPGFDHPGDPQGSHVIPEGHLGPGGGSLTSLMERIFAAMGNMNAQAGGGVFNMGDPNRSAMDARNVLLGMNQPGGKGLFSFDNTPMGSLDNQGLIGRTTYQGPYSPASGGMAADPRIQGLLGQSLMARLTARGYPQATADRLLEAAAAAYAGDPQAHNKSYRPSYESRTWEILQRMKNQPQPGGGNPEFDGGL